MAKLVRVTDPFDPERCEGSSASQGQCPFRSVPGSNMCLRHGGNKRVQSLAKDRERMYLLTKFKDRVDQITNHEDYKQLHNELGIMRVLLEKIWNQCEDAQDLLMHSARISSVVDKIERLAQTIDKMETRNALSPERLASLATQWIKIINVYVQDPNVLEQLSQQLLDTVDGEVLQIESSKEQQ